LKDKNHKNFTQSQRLTIPRTKIFRPIFTENHVMKIYPEVNVEFYTNLVPDYKEASGKFHALATLIQHKYHLYSLDKV